MAKKIFFMMLLVGSAALLPAATVPLTVGIDNNTPSFPGYPKIPVAPWYIYQDENILTMSATPCDYTLSLYNDDSVLSYYTFLPTGTTQVILPSYLSGAFEIRFETNTCYYFGYIYL